MFTPQASRRTAIINTGHPSMQSCSGLWTFTEGSGRIVRDYSGYNHHGTLNTSSSWSYGRDGAPSVTPTAETGWVTPNNALSNYISATDGSIAAWLRPTGSTSTVTSAWTGQGIVLDSGGYAGISRGSIGGSDRIWVFNNDGNEDRIGLTYNVDEWMHVVWVHTGGTLYAYKNGVLSSSLASGNTNSVAFTLYFTDHGSGPYFRGRVDEVRTWNRALGADEIWDLWARPYGIYRPVLPRTSFSISSGTTSQTISPSGITSANAFGTSVIAGPITAAGIASAQAFGTPLLVEEVSPTAIGTSEAFGTPVITSNYVISATGIPSSEAFGSGIIAGPITTTGLVSGEAFGAPTVEGVIPISPVGIVSGEAFGGSSVAGPLSVTSGIPSGEAFGTPVLNAASVISVTGIVSSEAFGSTTVAGSITLGVSGIASSGAIGQPILSGPIRVTGIASSEAFGGASVQAPTVPGSDYHSVYGSPTAIICTITSLATDSLRQSNSVTNNSFQYSDVLVSLKTKTTTGTVVNGRINLYVYASADDGTSYSGDTTGTDSGYSGTKLNLKFLGAMLANADNTSYKAGGWSVASAFHGYMPRHWGIVIENKTGGSLSSSSLDHSLAFQGVIYRW